MSDSAPQRIQRSRARGWRMPEGAVYVGRPSRWGNPFVFGDWVKADDDLWPYLVFPPERDVVSLAGLRRVRLSSVERCVDAYAWWILEQPGLMASLPTIVGHDLACWCDLSAPCHADSLLSLANELDVARR